MNFSRFTELALDKRKSSWYHLVTMMKTLTNAQIANEKTTAEAIANASKVIDSFVSLKALVAQAEKELKPMADAIREAFELDPTLVFKSSTGEKVVPQIETRIEYNPAKFAQTFPDQWSIVAKVDSAKVRLLAQANVLSPAQLSGVVESSQVITKVMIKKPA